MRWLRTFDTCARAVAYIGIPGHARRTRSLRGVTGYTIRTNIKCAGVGVIGNVAIVVNRGIFASHTNGKFAVTGDWCSAGRRGAIERYEGAGADARIAQIFGARIRIFAWILCIALDDAGAGFAGPNRFANGARRVLLERRMHGKTVCASIGRTRFDVVFDVRIVDHRYEHSIGTFGSFAITRNLGQKRAVLQVRPSADALGQARVDGARVLIVAIRIGNARGHRIGRLGDVAVRIVRIQNLYAARARQQHSKPNPFSSAH